MTAASLPPTKTNVLRNRTEHVWLAMLKPEVDKGVNFVQSEGFFCFHVFLISECL